MIRFFRLLANAKRLLVAVSELIALTEPILQWAKDLDATKPATDQQIDKAMVVIAQIRDVLKKLGY